MWCSLSIWRCTHNTMLTIATTVLQDPSIWRCTRNTVLTIATIVCTRPASTEHYSQWNVSTLYPTSPFLPTSKHLQSPFSCFFEFNCFGFYMKWDHWVFTFLWLAYITCHILFRLPHKWMVSCTIFHLGCSSLYFLQQDTRVSSSPCSQYSLSFVLSIIAAHNVGGNISFFNFYFVYMSVFMFYLFLWVFAYMYVSVPYLCLVSTKAICSLKLDLSCKQIKLGSSTGEASALKDWAISPTNI